MKTNQIMIRDYEVQQRTIDRYFNATSVLKYWNEQNVDSLKRMSDFLKLKSTDEFSNYLMVHEGIDKPIKSSTLGTWLHPKVFIDFCMWVSIEFKSMAIQWIIDGLIKSRNDAGDYYNEMTAQILSTYVGRYGTKPPAKLYIDEANMIKEIAGITKPRNELSESMLKKITLLQKVNSTLISDNVGRESRIKQLKTVSRSLD